VTTSSENVTTAQSTIADADMAKEMTAYQKNSVLQQASQAMLAQANQSGSGVLSLLK
jgi:flagellin